MSENVGQVEKPSAAIPRYPSTKVQEPLLTGKEDNTLKPGPRPETPMTCCGQQDNRKEARDPWQHRASNMVCRTCMWYLQKNLETGRCRRHAPTLGGWPVVFPIDWCGDHKLQ